MLVFHGKSSMAASNRKSPYHMNHHIYFKQNVCKVDHVKKDQQKDSNRDKTSLHNCEATKRNKMEYEFFYGLSTSYGTRHICFTFLFAIVAMVSVHNTVRKQKHLTIS